MNVSWSLQILYSGREIIVKHTFIKSNKHIRLLLFYERYKRKEQRSGTSRLFRFLLDTAQQLNLINSMLKNVIKMAKIDDLM